MWKRLAAGHGFDDIINQLALEFAKDRYTFTNDLKSFIDSLLKLGLLRERKNQASIDKAVCPAARGELKSYSAPKIHIYGPES
jgi:hypothetical protein